MRLIYRFYEIDSGQILIDGQDITTLRVNDLRQKIAIVPQDCVLFNDTIAYTLGNPRASAGRTGARAH